MKIVTTWKEKMLFEATDGSHVVPMDTMSPIGTDTAMTPKQFVILGLTGCTGMDVAAMMKKNKQPVETFEIITEVEKTQKGYPEVFTSAVLTFKLTGEIDPAKVLEAVTLSQTKYCGVSAMLSKVFPIHFKVEVNGELIGEGDAFPKS